LDVLGGSTLRHLRREVGIELGNISNGGWMAPADPNGVLLRQHRGGSPGSQQRGGKNEADSHRSLLSYCAGSLPAATSFCTDSGEYSAAGWSPPITPRIIPFSTPGG